MATSSKIEADLEAAAEPLKSEVAALRADLADLGKLVARIGKQRAAGLKSAAGATAADGYARGEHVFDAVLGELQSLEEELSEAARRRPFAALGLAALSGFLIGVLFPALKVFGPFATLFSVARARVRHAGQRLGLRLGLIAGCVLAGLVCLGFALAAATVALSERYGLLPALAIMAGAALAVIFLVLLVVLAIEARQERRIAARRADLDSRLMRSAAVSAAVPQAVRLGGRTGIGLGLVALGAVLVLARRRDREED